MALMEIKRSGLVTGLRRITCLSFYLQNGYEDVSPHYAEVKRSKDPCPG